MGGYDNPRVFVYGSLRRGAQHHRLLQGGRLLGSHQTPPRYAMFDCGGYPAVTAIGDTAISGEVYVINERTLTLLDRLEDYPQMYTRKPIVTRFGPAWIYLYQLPIANKRQIRSGDWSSSK